VLGIILAGGTGSRLYPTTEMSNKHSLSIYDKPMIYYPLTTLILAGVKEVIIVSGDEGVGNFKKLLKDGSQFGIRISYAIQEFPRGIADGISAALHQIKIMQPLLIILGDNIFHGTGVGRHIGEVIEKNLCTIWTQKVSRPQDFGILNLDQNGNPKSIIEKPVDGKSNLAITGLYYFPPDIEMKIQRLSPSNRGEFEVTDLLTLYLKENRLNVESLKRGVYWVDAGTVENLSDASQFVRMVQSRQGNLIGSPDEATFQKGNITLEHLQSRISKMPDSNYKTDLQIQFSENFLDVT
jgi:glucose-1-phosphate thymidylyltransferase